MGYRVAFLSAAIAIAIAIYFLVAWPIWVGWLIAINTVTFVLYRLDKRKAPKAKSGKDRVPENDLHLLTLLGGSVGAYIGMIVRPRHKISDSKFRKRFWGIVAIHIITIATIVAVFVVVPML